MYQANTSAWVLEQFVKVGTVFPDGHPLVKHAPNLFDRLVDDDDKKPVRKVPA